MKRPALVFAGILAVLLCLQVSSGKLRGTGNSQSLAFVPTQVPRTDADYGKIPLHFIPNEGQVDGPAAFYVQGKDKTIYFAPEGLTFVLCGLRESTLERWVVKLDFVDANPEAIPASLEKSGAVISYFKGKPEDWTTGLPASSKIVYRQLWPGIDLLYYGTVDRMKYEFLVHPGADPSKIKLAYRGAESVKLTEAGRLAIGTPLGGFEDDAPVAWQEVEKFRRGVPVAYVLKSEKAMQGSSAHVFGFEVGEYDKRLPLVLDPAVLIYCGYIGGWNLDTGTSIAVDGSGNAYITGFAVLYGEGNAEEGTFPVTVGPDLTFNGDPSDAFIAKVNADGSGLVYCGFIGGSGLDEAAAIAVDSLGNAYVAGRTSSGDFPVTPGSTLIYSGDMDAFVAKVNAAGTDLAYSGHIGGSGEDSARGIAVDGSGNAYITGAVNTADVLVAKVNAAGTDLIYSGYIDGGWYEEGHAIAVDGSGNAYITGRCTGGFPCIVGPDLTPNGWADAFVAKVNADGSALVYSGYIGGEYEDDGLGIAVDDEGNAYVTGYTCSSEASFPVTVGPDLTWNGSWAGGLPCSDAFVAKVNAAGTALVYCGYIGGNGPDAGNDRGNGIAVDGSGNAYVVGGTDSSEASFPVTGGLDPTWNGMPDAFVAKVNAVGTGLVYCGYIGGSEDDAGFGIALDGLGNAYVAGGTDSPEVTFPVTVGPDLTSNSGVPGGLHPPEDAFVAKISAYDIPIFTIEPSPTSVTVTAGRSAIYTVQVTPHSGSFDSAISFSCTGLPSRCSASFSPASVTPGTSTVTTTLTLSTQASSSAAGTSLVGATGSGWPTLGLFAFVAALLLGNSIHRRLPWRLSRHWLAAGAFVGLIILIGGCSAGGGDDQPPPYTGTPKGTYQIAVQGTSGSMTGSTMVTLVVN
jgi:hypothetical protein